MDEKMVVEGMGLGACWGWKATPLCCLFFLPSPFLSASTLFLLLLLLQEYHRGAFSVHSSSKH